MDDIKQPDRVWGFMLLGSVSMVFSLIIPVMYYYHPKTRQYPNIILVIICLAEFSEIYHLLVIIEIDWIQRFYNSIRELSVIQNQKMLQDLLKIPVEDNNFNIIEYLISFQLNLQVVWSLDLVLTLRNPLSLQKFRILFYIPFTITMVALQCSMKIQWNYFIIISVLQYVVIISTIVVCLVSISRAKRIPNLLIRQVKIEYLKQQAVNMFLVMIIGSFYVTGVLGSTRFGDEIIQHYYEWIDSNDHLFLIILLSQGIILGLIRFQEKYFRQQLLKSICSLLRIKNDIIVYEEHLNKSWNVPLSILIKTIYSQQVMFGILEGITKSISSYEQMSKTNQRKTYSNVLIQKQESIGNGKLTTHDLCDLREKFILNDQTIEMKVVEYEPSIFAYLRYIDSIGLAELEDYLCVIKNQIAVDQISESMGSSGALFFKNYNKKLLIKTLKKSELDFLIKILPQYDSYILSNRKSLLARIYGCFTVEIENIAPVYLILMENTFECISEPYQSYDMKGSLISRQTFELKFGKDVDFLEQQKFINLQKTQRNFLIKQIKRDSRFLRELNIMDYSLLLGVSQIGPDVSQKNGKNPHQYGRIFNNPLSNQTYSFGIIDYLQEYDTEKFIESKFKSILNEKKLISSVAPQEYSKRFIAFLNSILCTIKQH